MPNTGTEGADNAPGAALKRPAPAGVDVGRDVWSHAVPAIVIAASGIVAAFVVAWWLLVADPRQAAEAAYIDTRLATASDLLNARLDEFRSQVEAMAQSPIARELLLASQTATPGPNASFPAALPWFRRISVFPRGGAEVDLQAEVPISFAALDLIRKAEAEPFAGPEASLNSRNLIYAAAPITIQGKIAGTLFVALDAGWFAAPFSRLTGNAGTFELMQTFQANEPTLVTRWGEGGNNDAAVQKPTAHGSWSIRYLPASAPLPGPGITALLPSLALCIAVALGGAFIGFSRLGRKLAADLSTLQAFVARLLRDGNAPPQRYGLQSVQTVAAELAASAAAAPRATAGAEMSPALRAAAARTAGGNKPASPVKVGARINELLAENRDEAEEDDFLEVTTGPDKSRSRPGMEVEENPGPADFGLKLDPTIFRAYDIRGLTASNLSADVVYWIGRAFAGEALAQDHRAVVVARDGRLSSEALRDALVNGLSEGGLDVIDIGVVPTPVLYFGTHELATGTGIMITGSHNPPEYNGLKMVLAGVTLADDRIQRIKDRIDRNDLPRGEGSVQIQSLLDRYVARVVGDVAIADTLKVVVDCGNGVGGLVAPRLIEELGCEVIPLYCEVDGNFPNHHPDPAEPSNLEDLITVVQAEGADLGIAFDGDADRIGVVTNRGEIIWPDKLMMLFSQDIVGRNPGADIIYDVKCSRHLSALISEYGGRPVMWKTGHSHMKAKLQETGALLAGEFSGHICFGERWYGFDDALYAAARLLEIVSAEGRPVSELFAQFPVTFTTPELKVRTTDAAKFTIMDKLRATASFADGTVTTIDGLRVDFADGWGLIRPSNTGPVLSLRFEADGQAALQRIKTLFQNQLAAIDPALKIG